MFEKRNFIQFCSNLSQMFTNRWSIFRKRDFKSFKFSWIIKLTRIFFLL